MSSLGNLWYTLGIRDLTDADIQKINQKLQNAGSTITINPVLGKEIKDIFPKWVDVEIKPNQIAQDALDKAVNGKAMKAEILPLADKLKSAVVDALKDLPVPLNGLTIPPEKISAAVANALASANFTAVGDKAGDELAKAIKVKVEGYRYDATITAKTDKLTTMVNDALKKIFDKEQKIKFDRSDIRSLRDELRKAISENVKVTPTLNITQEALQKAVEGKVMRVEILPLVTNLRAAIKNAFNGNPAEIEVGVMEAKLRNLINTVLQKQGYMVNISTVTGLEKSITTQLNGRVYNVRIRANATEIANSVQTSLMQVQSRTFGLTVSKDMLRNSIDQALMGKPFNIQIAVMHDQARRAVQNALNNARMVGKDDALAYQRLQTGELRAAQAELARLKAAQQGAANAAKAHASASINLGGALGSNIKIAGELGSAMASLYSIHAAKQFLSQVIEIGGELEHQKIALETIYGSGSKMESLYGQIKGLARQSPFGVMELTKNIKQLSAYGVAYNEVYDTAKRLADISAATSVDIQRLILAFGKTKNRTFLDGLEAKQFAYANIPIYDMLSKKLTELEGKFVSVKDVMGRIKKREIGFDMVKDILWDMTDEGGKFYNMQEKLAGSLKTSFKLIKDNFELMLGEIAESKTGDMMQRVFEIIQKLTKEWKTLLTVLVTGGIGFAVYKSAVISANSVLAKHNVELLKSAALQNKETLAKTTGVTVYRKLTSEELRAADVKQALNVINNKNIFSSQALTRAQVSAMLAEKALTKDLALRLIATRKITAADAQYLVQEKLITQAEMSHALAASSNIKQIRILGTTVTFSAARFKLLGASIMSSLKAMGAFVLNPFTAIMTAIGAGLALWQKNDEEMQKAKEVGDNIFSSAVDGADSLKKTLEELKPSNELSSLELTQGIEKMQEAIKDYSPTPIKDINEALYTQDGLLRPLAERYDEMKKKLEGLKEAFDAIEDSNIGSAVHNAINDTNGSNWFTSLFNDDINTNAQDYAESLKAQSDSIRKYITDNAEAAREAVKAALENSAAFNIAAKDLKNWQQQFTELVKNWDKYSQDFDVRSKVNISVSLADDANSSKINEDKGKLLTDMEDFWESIKTSAAQEGIDALDQATDEVKKAYAISIKKWIEGLSVPDEVKQMMQNYYSDLLKFDFEIFNAQEMISNTLNKGLAKEVGCVIAEKVKNGLELTSEEADKVHQAFEKIYKELYEKVPDIQKEALEKATKQQTASGLVWSANKETKIIATLNVRADWDEWQREIDDTTGNLKPIQAWIKGSSDIESFIKAAQDGYKAAKDTADKMKPLMLKAGIEFEFGEEIYTGGGSLYQGMSHAQRRIIDEYNEAVRVVKAAKKAGDELGFDLQAEYDKKNGSKESKEDAVAKDIQQRFKDIKDAWSEFQKWSKTEGREAAATRIGESGLFSTLPKDKIPKTVEEYRALVSELEDELRKAGIAGHSQRESLLNELLKQLLDIDKTVVDEQLKLALEKVSKEAERQIADWNLFDKIRKATGNPDLAMSIAFGLNADAETDYPTMVKEQFNKVAKATKSTLTFDTATPELLKNAPEEVQKAWEKANSDILKYFDQQRESITGILSEYQTLQDKIDAINAKRANDLDIVNAKDKDGNYNIPDEAKRKKLEKQINTKADYDIFTQSNDYLRFFNDIYGLTMTEANRIGDLIQLNLNQKLQAGLISIYDYEQQMEKVRKQLEALRNVKSNALTFMTGGIKGFNEKRLREEEGKLANNEDYQNKLKEQTAAQEALNEAKEKGNEKDIKSAEEALRLASESLKTYTAVRDAIIKDQEKWQGVMDVTNIVANIAQGMSDTFNTLRDMADSFGFDSDSNAWNTAATVMDTLTTVTGGVQKVLQSAMSGDIGGMLSGVFDTLLTPITIWNKLHDKKLQKDIERSQKQQAGYERMINAIERRMTNFLGNPKYSGEYARASASSGGAYGEQRDLMQGQLAEMERQKADMEAMKKKDPEAIADLADQIDEMQVKIREFAMEVAKDLYGIDLNGWAEQLGDALVDAFAAGEDAAEAFDKTVSDILRDVTSKMISQDILAPMFGDLRDYLFGSDGMSGAFGADFQLDPSEMGAMKEYLDKIKNEGIPAAQELFDAINKATGGMLDSTEDAESSVSAGIRNITEDTADLLASYVNAIRAYVARMEMSGIDSGEYLRMVAEELIPRLSVISESQLRMQEQIASNTLRNAIAAEAIMKSNSEISRLLTKVTQGGAKFYIH